MNEAVAKSASPTQKETREPRTWWPAPDWFQPHKLVQAAELSGQSFLISIQRHILRNMVTLYALEQGKPIPIGTQDAALLDTSITDVDDEVPANDEGGGRASVQ